jgi:hypothetical protein
MNNHLGEIEGDSEYTIAQTRFEQVCTFGGANQIMSHHRLLHPWNCRVQPSPVSFHRSSRNLHDTRDESSMQCRIVAGETTILTLISFRL